MSIGGEKLLGRVREKFPRVTTISAFPYLRISVVSEVFADLDDEAREGVLADKLQLSVAELRHASSRLFMRFELLGDEREEAAEPRIGDTWLGAFASDEAQWVQFDGPRVVHCYGYKGGQGRSSLLGFLAFSLAVDGHRVLLVDIDAEAPSLDLLLRVDVPLEGSLVGLRAGCDLTPVAVHAAPGGGSVSLIGFRPATDAFELDATALAFEASVSAPSQFKLARQLWGKIAADDFSVVLFDHRTGLGATVPSWIHAVPGSLAVFDRLDGQSRRAIPIIERLWRRLGGDGVLISWLATTSASIDRARQDARADAWPWLEALARAKSIDAEEGVDAGDVEDHWVIWPEDNSFRQRKFPELHEVGGLTRDAISRIREVLRIGDVRRALPVESTRRLHPSGASDQGLFIVTAALRELRQPGSPIRFILGRKGTGKTRLLHELAQEGRGEPLVVAEDESIGGLSAQDPTLRALLKRAREAKDHEGFWWTLLSVALEAQGTEARRLEQSIGSAGVLAQAIDVKTRASQSAPRVFLIDGLESLSVRDEAKETVQALLNVCSAVENDATLRTRLTLRIFLRTDIARWGFENFEQQSAGKTLELSWSTQGILNFVLSRIQDLHWFARNFQEVVSDIRNREVDIRQGALSSDDCMELLLRIFPEKLRRTNINTSTFLKTYFSDDPGGESYYPRVYDKFLASIDEAKKPPVDGRVSEEVIMTAHDEASREFLTQVRQELANLTPLEPQKLDRFIGALNAQVTPFDRKELANKLRNSLKFKKAEIDATLEAMLAIGIFERHPSRPEAWRVGRLFKAALKMKYSR